MSARRLHSVLFWTLMVAVLRCHALVASEPRSVSAPRLVVLIVVDQLRGDLVTRFELLFTDGGFRRLQNGGALFVDAHYSYASTETAPGHATIATGRLPRDHGIIANRWFLDPSQKAGAHAVQDADAKPVPPAADSAAPGASPRSLIGVGFGDQLKLSNAGSRVFSVALKDRAAIFLAGRKPDGAYWWDFASGRFMSSTWYCAALPDYVEAYNAMKPAEKWSGASWEPLADPAALRRGYPVDPHWHHYLGLGATFPHVLPTLDPSAPRPYFSALGCSPFGNDLVIDLAERLVDAEKLGQNEAPDMLCVGLSSNDLVGHFFGIDSPEVLDMTLQTDRRISGLLQFLDRKVGLENCLIALTGDHGATTPPNLTTRLGLGGGVLDIPDLQYKLNDQLQGFFPTPDHGQPPHTIVLGVDIPWVYLNRPMMATLSIEKRRELLRRAADVVTGFDGVAEVFTADELHGPAPSPDDESRWLAWRSFHPERSGELFVRLKPYWYKTDDKIAGHDGGSNHDRHVPIFLRGPRVRPGRYYVPADPRDIVVTLAALLGIEPPLDATGRVLHEALDARVP